jgi:putative ABC transport system ATP-binding protein
MALIDISNLRHQYGGRTVLNLPAWQVEAGRHALVLGASGSGKSTLLTLLAGLLSVQTGKLSADGFDLGTASPAARDAWRGRHVGLVLQRLHLIAALSVRDNLRLAQALAGMPRDDVRIDTVLSALGVAGLAARKPHAISVGEAQRVAIARAVLNRPALILADEPTSALDDAACNASLDLLFTAAQEAGATLVVATHDQRIQSRFEDRLRLEAAT